MRKKWILAWLLALAAIGLLTGCDGAATSAATPENQTPVAPEETEYSVIAEAVIEPARWSELRFETGGTVAEVLVQQGSAVSEGDILVQLERDSLERAFAQAELDLRQAQLRLERIQEPATEADIRRAEHAVSQAAAALDVAQLNLTAVNNSALLNEALEDAQDAFDDAQHHYQARLAEYEQDQIDYWFVDQAEQRLNDARLALARVQQQADAQLEGVQSDVTRAWQAYQEAQDNLDLLLSDPTPQDLEAAQIDIQAAELALEQARSGLDGAALRAPFDGTVTRVDLNPGETATSGAVALVIATLNQLQARTVDLVELDVARVVEGQAAEVTVDALPNTPLQGTVTRIDLQPQDYRGDVTYPITIALEETPPELRWGMTAMVEIETD